MILSVVKVGYNIVKKIVRIALAVFCRKIIFSNENGLKAKGPLLLACNHPNSFLDALIIGCYFQNPVHFLARGDAFKHPVAKKLLTALKVIPIYRLSEGKEYLALNDATFERCTRILKRGGIVLIFSEGLCINQWKLRPLKKGTARIALNAWSHISTGEPFRIMPVSINYSSFSRFRKTVLIHFGECIYKKDLSLPKAEGEQMNQFNQLLYARLEAGLMMQENVDTAVPFILSNIAAFNKNPPHLIKTLKAKQQVFRRFETNLSKLSGTKKAAVNPYADITAIVVFCIPALIGLAANYLLYLPVNRVIKKKTTGTVFYHSALLGALIVAYPFYVLIISLACMLATENVRFLLLPLILPLLAKLFLVWKDWLEGVVNYYTLPAQVRKNLTR